MIHSPYNIKHNKKGDATDVLEKNVKSVLLNLGKKLPLAKYLSGRVVWLRQEIIREILYLSFGFWGKFMGQNLEVIFRHPDEIPES